MQQEELKKKKNTSHLWSAVLAKQRNKDSLSFKCGLDYIDPMFHTQVIGTKSRNLDTFLQERRITEIPSCKNSADCEIAVMEGVMDFTMEWQEPLPEQVPMIWRCNADTPVILIVNSKGMSVSLAAYIKGFWNTKKGQPHKRRDF